MFVSFKSCSTYASHKASAWSITRCTGICQAAALDATVRAFAPVQATAELLGAGVVNVSRAAQAAVAAASTELGAALAGANFTLARDYAVLMLM